MTSLPHLQEGIATSQSRFSLLREGRDSAFEGHAHTLMHMLAGALGVSARPGQIVNRTLIFTINRPNVALRGLGADQVYVLILASCDASWATADSLFWKKVESAGDMPIILACGDEEYEFAKHRTAGRLALVLQPANISELLSSPRPIETLKQLIRSQFKPGHLHPFDHQRPAVDASFRGRHAILQTLRDNPNTNFALIGPSMMGKTSLVKRHLSIASGGNRDGRRVYVDLFARPIQDLALARAIRMAIDPSLSAYHDPVDSLPDFLAKVKSRLGGPFEIVLDETDKHLDLPTMGVLIHLAVNGLYRIILVGRWGLMKHAVHSKDDNFIRLEAAPMPPLSIDEAMEIIERPLVDMGFDFSSCRHDFRNAIHRLGRVPGLVQELGAFFVEEAGRASPSDALRKALNRIISATRIIGLLNDLSCVEARAAALLFAHSAEKGGEAEPLWLKAQFKKHGIGVGVARCIEICDELVIHHLLGYESGVYRMARWDIVAESHQQRSRFDALLEEELEGARTSSPLS